MKKFRQLLSPLIIVLTVGLFIYYIATHQAVLTSLGKTNPFILVGIVLLYLCMFATLMVMYDATLRLVGKRLGNQENLLLTCYTALINFFGPLQSGPAFRAAYLKKKHNVSLKHYTIATLAYYALYLLLNGCLLFIGTNWWIVALPILIVTLVAPFIAPRILNRFGLIGGRYVPLVMVAVLLQMVVMICIYFTELHAGNAHITMWQTFSYTGTANLSLFVSLTPAGIGIREAFLLFTSSLHHISTNEIVAANIIDRAAYILYMGVLFILGLALHATDRLQAKKLRAVDEQ